jgi:hypothetical protein
MIQSMDVTNAFLDGMNKGLVVRLLIIIQIEKSTTARSFCISYSPWNKKNLNAQVFKNIIHHFAILIKKKHINYIYNRRSNQY